MGTWGYGNFDNDTALDWLDEFLWGDQSIGFITQAFQTILETTDYLDADDCRYALAGCEVIAALKDLPAPRLPQRLMDWAQLHDFEEVEHLLQSALNVIERITTDSELRDLWEEGSEYQLWLAVQTDLQACLKRNNGA